MKKAGELKIVRRMTNGMSTVRCQAGHEYVCMNDQAKKSSSCTACLSERQDAERVASVLGLRKTSRRASKASIGTGAVRYRTYFPRAETPEAVTVTRFTPSDELLALIEATTSIVSTFLETQQGNVSDTQLADLTHGVVLALQEAG